MRGKNNGEKDRGSVEKSPGCRYCLQEMWDVGGLRARAKGRERERERDMRGASSRADNPEKERLSG